VKIQKEAEPGDLLFSIPKDQNPVRAIGRKFLIEAPQGTKFGHAAIVTSPQTVVEGNLGGVREKSFDQWLEDNTALLARVNTSSSARKEAAKRAREITGRKYSIMKAFKSYLWPNREKEDGETVREKARKMKSMICSTVVAIAYPDIDFHLSKSKLDVMPVDILQSDKVRIIETSFEDDEDLDEDAGQFRLGSDAA